MKNLESRTYADYESINECMEAFEKKNPYSTSITYDINQLFEFVDGLTDMSCLIFQKSTNTYSPFNKDWIKEKVYTLLRKQAEQY